MDLRWIVVGFQHSNNRVRYKWTYSVVKVASELTLGRLAQLVEWAEDHGVWFNSRRLIFLCVSEVQQQEVEQVLTASMLVYATELCSLSIEDKQIIQRSQISRRDKIADLLNAPRPTTIKDIWGLERRLEKLEMEWQCAN